MKFKINNAVWTIKVVDEATINNEMKQDGTLGVTIYKTQEILLLKDQANIVKTLKHELMHVWLYEYGHVQNDNTTYDYEDICEIVASSNDFINKIVDKYKKTKFNHKKGYEENTISLNAQHIQDKIISEIVKQTIENK